MKAITESSHVADGESASLVDRRRFFKLAAHAAPVTIVLLDSANAAPNCSTLPEPAQGPNPHCE